MWKIIRTVSKGDYTYAVVPEHPNATSNGYVLEHRIVMENYLGRVLTREELVHHKNENKKDNALSNLEVISVQSHNKLHGTGRKYVDLVCPFCKTVFSKPHNKTHLCRPTGWTACSNSCRGKFSRKTQLEGVTDFTREAIENNVVAEYIKFTPS